MYVSDNKKLVNDFLIKKFILVDPYREHCSKNFDDKIFFYEPINKYYDLLWLKRYAFQEIMKFIGEGFDQSALQSAGDAIKLGDDNGQEANTNDLKY